MIDTSQFRAGQWLVRSLLAAFALLAGWSIKVQLDYFPKTNPPYRTP